MFVVVGGGMLPFFDIKKSKPIWLIGENLAQTTSNNSFYFWKYVASHHDDVDAYFVLDKKYRTKIRELNLPPRLIDRIVWQNSLLHHKLFFLADIYFCSLSFRDVIPTHIFFKSLHLRPHTHIVYLAHGVTGFKKMGYKSNYANNCLFRYLTYINDRPTQEKFEATNFKPYQCLHGQFQPRYQELAKRFLAKKSTGPIRNILWFLTWREYKDNSWPQRVFFQTFLRSVSNKSLHNFLVENNLKLTICLHAFFSKVQEIQTALSDLPDCVTVKYAGQVDVMDEIVNNDLLITDYSSVAYDFTFLKKPVLLYPFDWDFYKEGRDFYIDEQDLLSNSVFSVEELIEKIQEQICAPNICKLFANQLCFPDKYENVANGFYLEQLYQYFWEKQKNQIIFWGYDFTGVGGTVFATKALAEGLLENGYMVKLMCLKKAANGKQPAGLPVYPMYESGSKSKLQKLKIVLLNWTGGLKFLKHDPDIRFIRPVAGCLFNFWMNHNVAKTVVSTRESLHYSLYQSDVPNKVFFFHTAANCVNEIYPGCIEDFQAMNLPKAAFVSENNQKALFSEFGFDSYKDFAVVGNSLDSSRMIEREDITLPIFEDDKLKCAYLLRISKERSKDIERLLEFAKFCRDRTKNIVINVYGRGDYLEEFLELILKENLYSIIRYRGATNDVCKVYRENACTVDFSYIQSFGMTYIESILNGRMCFAFPNEGSMTVLKDIDGVVNNYQELYDRLVDVKNIPLEVLMKNYEKVYSKFSRQQVALKFEKLLR